MADNLMDVPSHSGFFPLVKRRASRSRSMAWSKSGRILSLLDSIGGGSWMDRISFVAPSPPLPPSDAIT